MHILQTPGPFKSPQMNLLLPFCPVINLTGSNLSCDATLSCLDKLSLLTLYSLRMPIPHPRHLSHPSHREALQGSRWFLLLHRGERPPQACVRLGNDQNSSKNDKSTTDLHGTACKGCRQALEVPKRKPSLMSKPRASHTLCGMQPPGLGPLSTLSP